MPQYRPGNSNSESKIFKIDILCAMKFKSVVNLCIYAKIRLHSHQLTLFFLWVKGKMIYRYNFACSGRSYKKLRCKSQTLASFGQPWFNTITRENTLKTRPRTLGASDLSYNVLSLVSPYAHIPVTGARSTKILKGYCQISFAPDGTKRIWHHPWSIDDRFICCSALGLNRLS